MTINMITVTYKTACTGDGIFIFYYTNVCNKEVWDEEIIPIIEEN